MLEMAEERSFFIEDILYVYNRTNPLNEDKINNELQLSIEDEVRSKPIYPRLEKITMTFFNIVIPLYNAEKWLTRCLKTVMAQDYNNYRVIIVDDCSTDNSKSVIESQIEGNEKFTLISAQKKRRPDFQLEQRC